MEKYLFVYYGGKMASTPTELKSSMDVWMNWFKSQGKAVVDAGNPTTPGQLISRKGVKALNGKIITGYSVFQAAGLEAAIAIAKTSPQLEGGEIAVYPVMATM